MANIDKSISRTIARIGWLDIKMSIPLQGDQTPLLQDYEAPDGENVQHYISLNHFPMVIIECARKEFKKYKRKKSLIMTNRNQHIIVKAFEKMKEILYRDDLFYTRDGYLYTYHIDEDMLVKEYGAGANNNFVLYPTVITMEGEGKQYEGVRMFFNESDISLDLSIDEFESALNVLKKIDIFVYSQALLNFYMTYKDKIEKETVKPAKRKNLFKEPPPPPKEQVVSTIVKKDAGEDIMSGLDCTM